MKENISIKSVCLSDFAFFSLNGENSHECHNSWSDDMLDFTSVKCLVNVYKTKTTQTHDCTHSHTDTQN